MLKKNALKYNPSTGILFYICFSNSGKVFNRNASDIQGNFNKVFWRNFRKNTLAFASLIFILLWCIAAILGYLITPDSTPHANQQNLEIATHRPGHVAQLLFIKMNAETQNVSPFRQMISGKQQEFSVIPIQRYRLEGAWLYYETYQGHPGYAGIEDKIWLPDVIYSLAPLSDTVLADTGEVGFYLLSGQRKGARIKDLQQEVLQNHIVNQKFLLGTDRFGRDMLSQLIIGARVSLSVGFISVFISLVLGLTLGCIAGFYRGRMDDAIMWLINVVWSIPTLLLVIAITFALGKGFWQIFVAVGLTMWVDVARIARGQVLSVREKEFVLAARALGLSHFRIITRHILPNIIGPIVVISAANFASAILIEAGLSFLGIGVQPPMPSWGSMIREHYGYIILGKSFLAFLPGILIMLMVLAFMLLGNGLREAFDKNQKV